MNKEEILKRAQEENDEMDQVILTKALGISTLVIPILAIIFILFRIINAEKVISDLVVITLAQLSISEIYHGVKMKKILLVFLGVVSLIAAVAFLFAFINEVRI